MALVTVPHSRASSSSSPRALCSSPPPSCMFVLAGVAPSPTGNRTSMANSGAWMGSYVDGGELGRLRGRRYLGLKEEVGTRAPGTAEVSPDPGADEFVVFSSHLARGLALPASPILQQFLSFYGLQLHHLGANSITLLSCFVTLCEAYLGIWPCMEIFGMFFFLRA